jgi:hypothetical protein
LRPAWKKHSSATLRNVHQGNAKLLLDNTAHLPKGSLLLVTFFQNKRRKRCSFGLRRRVDYLMEANVSGKRVSPSLGLNSEDLFFHLTSFSCLFW